MTPEEEATVAAVTGTLVGTVRPMHPRRWIDKGEVWMEVVDCTPPGVSVFDGYECRRVDLPANTSGWITGIVYDGKEPVGLKIEPAYEP